ncbi:o-succinylbenzoate synthase [Gloeocapsopsis crepidinum LEGE 06123]|uniref:o-succinylbenzoate synthase n=1 Tax=Gloeocapsopsis crepidinum LEGE 06123 TaxID=588587 RepID=A0ABR9USX9_9CHRO|nr:o-succinylbenzoate synthase [Gloeocapsopsis crepidinum]MBE9191364.1 o-succinylbenzoate synthase [Gloeocapsopsis crepidinum LEGE 06123]
MKIPTYQFEFRYYQRQFQSPLHTSHGNWEVRTGIILRFTDKMGKVSYGEIAPIRWFGSETIEQAETFCCQLPQELTPEMIFSIPDTLPACQFGFESALAEVRDREHNLECCGLLPAGNAALVAWQRLWEEGYRTFKWKIGVEAIAQELEIFEKLMRLPVSAKLRLDANGGLSYSQANLWLQRCDRTSEDPTISVEVEYLEQPLAVAEFAVMLELSRSYKCAIALDESVATLQQLQECYHKGWRGIFIIKPAIAGFPSRLRQFCHKYQIDAVFSSVFETEIGRLAALRLATELSSPHRAIGFGVDHLLQEADSHWLENLWNTR